MINAFHCNYEHLLQYTEYGYILWLWLQDLMWNLSIWAKLANRTRQFHWVAVGRPRAAHSRYVTSRSVPTGHRRGGSGLLSRSSFAAQLMWTYRPARFGWNHEPDLHIRIEQCTVIYLHAVTVWVDCTTNQRDCVGAVSHTTVQYNVLVPGAETRTVLVIRTS